MRALLRDVIVVGCRRRLIMPSKVTEQDAKRASNSAPVKKQNTFDKVKKPQLMMNDQEVYAWRATHPLTREEKKKIRLERGDAGKETHVEGPRHIFFMFRWRAHGLDRQLVDYSRPEEEEFGKTLNAITAKVALILVNRNVKDKRNKKDNNDDADVAWPDDAEFKITANFGDKAPEGVDPLKMPCLAAIMLSPTLHVNDVPYRLVHLPYPIERVHFHHDARVGFPLVANIKLKKNHVGVYDPEEFSRQFRYFWFVSDKPERFEDRLSVSWQPYTEDEVERAQSHSGCSASASGSKANGDGERLQQQRTGAERMRPHLAKCTFVCEAEVFTPTSEHAGKYLGVVVSLQEPHSLCYATKTAVATVMPTNEELPLLAQEKIDWARKDREEYGGDKSSLSIVNYNMLSDCHMSEIGKTIFHPYCPGEYIAASYRHPLIFKELLAYDADVYVLQEACEKMGKAYLPILFNHMGHGYDFRRKFMQVKEGTVIAWRKARFREKSRHCWWLTDLLLKEEENEDIRSLLSKNEETRKRFESRPPGLHVVELLDMVDDKPLIVCAAHLHSDPSEENLKVLQAVLIMRKLASELRARRQQHGSPVRLLFGADLNSTPDGAVLRLLQCGVLKADDEVWRFDEKMGGERFELPNECRELLNLSGTPHFTNYTRHRDQTGKIAGFVGCIDYVLGMGLSRVGAAPHPSEEQVLQHIALPSIVAPSDHLATVLRVRIDSND